LVVLPLTGLPRFLVGKVLAPASQSIVIARYLGALAADDQGA